MERIDDYINKVYGNFDEKSDDIGVLKEEMKTHLYEEIEELKRQGLDEEISIKTAILNFGEEDYVTNEMTSIVNKKCKHINVFIIIALIIYLVGVVFKGINLFYDLSGKGHEIWQITMNDTRCSEHIFSDISEILKSNDEINSKSKEQFDKILNEFNDLTDNGLYYIAIEDSEGYIYEYNKEISDGLIKINNNEGIKGWRLKNDKWYNIHYKRTDLQSLYDSKIRDIVWDMREQSLPNRLNEYSHTIFVASWLLICILFLCKSYVERVLSVKYCIFFLLPSILIIGFYVIGKHTLEESLMFIVGGMIFLTRKYTKSYFNDRVTCN